MPSITRAANSQASVGANNNASREASPIIKNPIEVPIRLTSNTGLRPTRSESFPRIGANKNCIAEYVATNIPIVASEAPYRSAYNGNTGMTIPNPTRSMKIVMKMITRGDKRLFVIFGSIETSEIEPSKKENCKLKRISVGSWFLIQGQADLRIQIA